MTSKAKSLALASETSETQSAKKILDFGNKVNSPASPQKKKEELVSNTKKPSKAKTWYELTLEEEEDDQLQAEINQQGYISAFNSGMGDIRLEKVGFPRNEEFKNPESQSFPEPMEEDAGLEFGEANLQIDALLDEDWNEDGMETVEAGEEEEGSWEDDDLLDDSFVLETGETLSPMEEDAAGLPLCSAQQDQITNTGLSIKDLSKGGLPPRGPHLRFSPARKKKYPIVGVSSKKWNALPSKKSPRNSPPAKSDLAPTSRQRPTSQSPLPQRPGSTSVGVLTLSGPSNGLPGNGPRPGVIISKPEAVAGPHDIGPDQTSFPLNEEHHKLPRTSTSLPTGSASAPKPVKKKG